MARIYVEFPEFEKSSKLKLGKLIYCGDGEIFTIVGHPNKLVKIVPWDSKARTKKMLSLFKYLKKTKNKAVVKIHKSGTFTSKNMYGDKYYYYVMDRLKPLRGPKIEKLVSRISDYLEEDAGLYGFKCGNKESKAVKEFVKKAIKLKYRYGDVHSGNIMKDKNGALKFVDLESFY